MVLQYVKHCTIKSSRILFGLLQRLWSNICSDNVQIRSKDQKPALLFVIVQFKHAHLVLSHLHHVCVGRPLVTASRGQCHFDTLLGKLDAGGPSLRWREHDLYKVKIQLLTKDVIPKRSKHSITSKRLTVLDIHNLKTEQ